MQDWSKYIERPIVEVLPEMEAEGDWWVDDFFENGVSYQETTM